MSHFPTQCYLSPRNFVNFVLSFSCSSSFPVLSLPLLSLSFYDLSFIYLSSVIYTDTYIYVCEYRVLFSEPMGGKLYYGVLPLNTSVRIS